MRDTFWKLVLVAVLALMAGGIYYSAKALDYTWRWSRVPQYFAYYATDDIPVPEDGVVEEVNPRGDKTEIVFTTDADERVRFTVDTTSVNVSEGEYLFEGDSVGYVAQWRMGPLTWGLWTTLWISLVAGIAGLIIGIFTGLCRISKNPALKGLSTFYVELIRGTPLLVQIFIFYFFIGTILHLDRIVAGVGALALFAGAYVAEIVRAGIQSIARGQTEAARSLGMNIFQTMRHIILPQALKRTLPPLAGQFISLVKDSSLLSVIAITDLTKAGREVITSTFATFEIWFTVAALYLIITGTLSQLVQWVERRLAISD